MADHHQWSADASNVIDISLVQPGTDSLQPLSTFHPHFTYSIFGDQEQIFGYQGLKIQLRFAAHDLYPNVAISYDTKFKPVGDTKATDILHILKQYLPAYAFSEASDYKARIQNDHSAAIFSPPGILVESYTSKNRNYEIWCAELTDPAVRLILERMQIFVSFFIEGGTPLELDDQEWTLARWRVFFIYEKLSQSSTTRSFNYSIVGYSTSYRFLTYQTTPSTSDNPTEPFTFPPKSPISISSLPCRSRISQFLILPPHQSHSHGTHLYNTMASIFLGDPFCTEITVEDPNEAFDDLRDYCDYKRLLTNGTLTQIKLNTELESRTTAKRSGLRVPTSKLLDVPLLNNLRKKNKLAPRQFARLVEIYLLSQIPIQNRQSGTARLTKRGKATDQGDRAYYYWRLLVKQRIYKRNKDLLIQLYRTERIDKVEETLGDQGADYERLLRNFESKELESDEVGTKPERGKRKVIYDEEEDQDENGATGREIDRMTKKRRPDDG